MRGQIRIDLVKSDDLGHQQVYLYIGMYFAYQPNYKAI